MINECLIGKRVVSIEKWLGLLGWGTCYKVSIQAAKNRRPQISTVLLLSIARHGES